jgi:hypothetical protein
MQRSARRLVIRTRVEAILAVVAFFAIAACGAAFRARHDLRIVKTAS